jgi:sigma-B regulation protein RsbU (phosphoserine phosphatase)
LRRAVLGVTLVAAGLAFFLPCPPGDAQARPAQPVAASIGAAGTPPAGPPAAAKTVFDATMLGSPVLLDEDWRVGISSDPNAASPDFDDSSWAVRDAHGVMSDVPDEDSQNSPAQRGRRGNPGTGQNRRFAWFRLHVKLAPVHGPLALLVQLPVSQNTSLGIGSTGPGVDVFANGKLIHPEGPHGDAPQHYQQISRIYDLNLAPDETSLVLVIRTIYIPFGYSAYTSFFVNRTLYLGHHEDLQNALQTWADKGLFERLPRLIDSILLLILGLFLFALFFAQRNHIEYLWLALHELVQAPIAWVELAGNSARLDTLWYAAVVLELVLISSYLYFEFLIAFVGLKPKRWFVKLHIRILRYTSPLLAAVGPSLLLVGHTRSVGVVLILALVVSFFWMAGWLVFVLVTLVVAAIRRNFEAGLLLIPLVLVGIGILEPVFTSAMSDWSGQTYHSPLTIQAGSIPIHFASIADFVGILVIVLIIFVRFLRIQADQERASSELAAARSVQELMIPQEKLATPGFEVDTVYDPANEVGGDFFHVQTVGDGGLLVVIGDVAGKGLKAAMNVSMLMGALRKTTERGPAKILESLNRVLAGSDSFTTCQVALFGANGELTIANAGHIPPYLNSQEVELPGGLPLGVLSENRYEEVRLYLHPGDRLLMVSDGVVEARQPSGELFGFDRVHNLSNQSAFYVAEAAKDFGQEDDITVLTVRRLAMVKAA